MWQTKDLDPFSLTAYTKINLRWIKDLNVKARNTKLLEKHIREYFQDKGEDFLARTQKTLTR